MLGKLKNEVVLSSGRQRNGQMLSSYHISYRGRHTRSESLMLIKAYNTEATFLGHFKPGTSGPIHSGPSVPALSSGAAGWVILFPWGLFIAPELRLQQWAIGYSIFLGSAVLYQPHVSSQMPLPSVSDLLQELYQKPKTAPTSQERSPHFFHSN